MHIVEKDEEVDWYIFNTKGLPEDAGHGEYTKALGNRHWAHLHSEADSYGCGACKPGFQMMVSGIHDTKNIELGKGVYDPVRYKDFVEYVNAMYRRWEKEGEPIHEDSQFLVTKKLSHNEVVKDVDRFLVTKKSGLVH